MLPEEKARVKIDEKLSKAGWYVVDRDEYAPQTTSAIREALAQGNKESDYLLFIDNKAIAVLEAKRADNPLGEDVGSQAENYARTPLSWYGLWENGFIPLVYLSNGEKILFKNLLSGEDEYTEIDSMHTPKEMLRLIKRSSEYGALPKLEKQSLRDCQYNAEINFEKSIKNGKKKNLAVLATGSGKTYLACLASYLLICEGGDIGRSAIWNFDFEMRIQNHLHRLRGYIPDICQKYYYYLMWLYKDKGMIDGRGIGLQGFSSKRVHELVVPLPPLAEQKRIAETLEKVLGALM